MKAAWYKRFGAAEEVLETGEMADPEPAPGEVLVRLEVSGVNPSDVKKRAGSFPDLLEGGAIVPHSDGAGVIEAVGAGVSHARIGERVWVYQAQFARRFGTAAEYVSLPAVRAAHLPAEASFDEGACLGIPAMTAHRCVFADGPVDGQIVLVYGGAGRVGSYAVQLAKLAGATVIATASEEAGAADCRRAGADHVVNHRDEDFAQQVRDLLSETLGKVDRVIDVEFGANLSRTLDLLRTGGVIATYASSQEPEPRLPFFRMLYMDVTVRIVIVYSMPEEAKLQAIEDIGQHLRHGRLLHRIASKTPLDEIATAPQDDRVRHERLRVGGVRWRLRI